MKAIYFILFVVMAGCNGLDDLIDNERINTSYEITTELQPYVDDFYFKADSLGIVIPKENLIISMVDSLRNNIPAGLYNEDGQMVIYFNRDFLNESSHSEIQFMVFHQLGHRFLHRDHVYGLSIMNPDLPILEYENPIKKRLMIAELFYY